MTTYDRHRLQRPLRGIAAIVAMGAALTLPAIAVAHPLGNFTINHYAGIRIEPDRILLDIVIDEAEIPTFQARLDFDTDGDGEVSDEETDAGREAACRELEPSLALSVDGARLPLVLDEAGLTFPMGAGGLNVMRVVCGFSAALGALGGDGTEIAFTDSSFTGRLGWREIVAVGSGVTVAPSVGEVRSNSVSDRLRSYPAALLTQPLADATLSVLATPGGPTLPAMDIADAAPLAGAAVSGPATGSPEPRAPTAAPPTVVDAAPVAASVPGGVSGADLPAIFRS
ncbi:MAG TPA: hypothetical protein VF119_05655, partial [Candidatus Limnocylindrales bacterium]